MLNLTYVDASNPFHFLLDIKHLLNELSALQDQVLSCEQELPIFFSCREMEVYYFHWCGQESGMGVSMKTKEDSVCYA